MVTQPVVIDKNATDQSRLEPQSSAGTTPAPPVINQVSSGTQAALNAGMGIVRYHTSATGGSNQLLPFAIPKGHKLLRVEIELYTSGNAIDSFTSAVTFYRYLGSSIVPVNGVSSSTSYIALQATPSTTPYGNIVFVFGDGWQNDNCIYAVGYSATGSDTIDVQTIVEYLG